MAAVIGRGAFGNLVAGLQTGLARLGYYGGGIDGDFGGGTERAVRSLQADQRMYSTGAADPKTWKAATGCPWPELFERCLQVTARFEGHGFGAVAGNFDGAGLTWGVIGFTLKYGELQTVVKQAHAQNALLLRECFGDKVDELMARMDAPIDAALFEWADSISAGANKYAVQEPWRSSFSKFGMHETVREIQRQHARERYFEPALLTGKRVQENNELSSEFGIALCFDIHVQNGGIEEGELEAYRHKLASFDGQATDSDKRLALARIVADNSKAKYRDDVFARKSTLATGAGFVHGQMFKLVNWGLSDKKRRKA